MKGNRYIVLSVLIGSLFALALPIVRRKTSWLSGLADLFAYRELVDLLAIVLLFASCESLLQPTKEALFHSAFPVPDTNNPLRLDIVESSIVNGLGPAVTLSVSNWSKHLIVFPADFGPRAFQYNPDRSEWVELENFVGLPGRPRILGRRGSDIPHMGLIDFGFKELLSGAPAEIRIVVRGNFLLADETLGDPVVAYLDLGLDP